MTAFADQILTRCELQRELKWKGSAKSSSSASRLSGGRGKGAARRTVRRASRSSCALPLDRSSESPRKSPRGPLEKEISPSPSRWRPTGRLAAIHAHNRRPYGARAERTATHARRANEGG